MSATAPTKPPVAPYSSTTKRFPLPPWARTVLILAFIIVFILFMTWVFVLPGASKDPAVTAGVGWSPGKAMTLPKDQLADTGPVGNTTAKPDTPATPPVVAPALQPMLVWGSEAPTTGINANANGKGGPLNMAGKSSKDADQRLNEASVFDDLSMMIPKDTKFDCLLNQAIDTHTIGDIDCTVDQLGGIPSADGSNVLIDRGAIVSGHIVRGLADGDNTVLLDWTEIRSGRVHVNFPGVGNDLLGQMGVPGEVSSHLWQQIKAATILTGIQTGSNVIQNYSQKEGSTNLNFNNGQSLAQQALQRDLNIQPTLWQGLGTVIKVRFRENVWFHKAYGNRLIGGTK